MKKTLIGTAQTEAFGIWLASKVKPGQIISLEGPLAAGKTTLLQGLAAGLGIKQRETSPTFILFRVLSVKNKKIKWLVHADAYRVKKAKEMLAAGIQDYFDDPYTLTVVEWGQRIKKILPKKTLHLKLLRPKNLSRRIIVWPTSLGKLPKNWYKKTKHAQKK